LPEGKGESFGADQQTRELLEHRLAFEKLISSISTNFINVAAADLDSEIEKALETIGRFVSADRAYIYTITEDDQSAHLTHEWNADPNAVRGPGASVPLSAFPWTRGRLDELQHVTVSVDELPPDAAAEREAYQRAGNQSIVVVPMIYNRASFGALGVASAENRKWNEETASLLRISGEIFVNAIQRHRAEAALRASEEQHRLLFERNLAGVYRTTIDGRILDCNEAMARILGFSSREELMERSATELYQKPAERSDYIAILRRDRMMTSNEISLRRKDGQPCWLLESVHLLGGDPEILEGTVIDITDRKRAEDALRESEARYRLMTENSTDMISRTSNKGIILYASDASRRLLGYEPSELTGRSFLDFVFEADRDEVRHLSSLIHESGPTTFAYRVEKKDGSLIWFETTSRSLRDVVTGDIREIVGVSRDITERKNVEEQIEFQAYHDALTGLPNRRLFRDRLTIALAHARRLKRPLAVMFLDLDRFKVVNDTLGHSVGDELLKAIGLRLQASLREEDSIARMGGDEFTVLLADLKSSEQAAKIALKVLDTIAQPLQIEGTELFITTSIGIALFPNDGETAEVLLANADHAMYRAKDAGRNSYQMFTPAMNSRALERLSLENDLRHAIDRGELVLHYQPQINIATGRLTGCEALIRWNRPGYGLVGPGAFIPIAEESRLIVPIGEWVLREACRQAREWQSDGEPGFRMAVNLSPRQFQHSDLQQVIASALEESGLAPGDLELEITESLAMQNTTRTIGTLHRLREMGVQIAIDDFGTGHSSLNYLRSFPIDSVKIDQEFVQAIEPSAADRAIVSAVIGMARGLRLRVTAEGVETERQLEFLREQGCEDVQGFLFGEPVPATAFQPSRGKLT
jgi:diguanylate cyclase (GGDEF)-like protein/PAS domain S-box-containing protein